MKVSICQYFKTTSDTQWPHGVTTSGVFKRIEGVVCISVYGGFTVKQGTHNTHGTHNYYEKTIKRE